VTSTTTSAVISDADVLIDYVRAAKGVLEVMAKDMWDVYVPHAIIAEVEELSLTEARRIALIVYEPTLDELTEATVRGGPLSERDKLCFCIARNKGWACLTNDGLLRKRCRSEDVQVIWGLEALLTLHENDLLSMRKAIDTAWAIHRVNPHYIHAEVVEQFVVKIGKKN